MKAKILIFSLKSLALIAIMGLFACEGEMGLRGPEGPQGSQGPQGVAGQDGQNGAENCIDCHGNNQLITAKLFQWENSIHALGGHYERNQASCAACHTSQGFLDRIASGEMEASMDTPDPLPQNCYTCHQIHTTYTYDDWAFTADDPVTLWTTGETFDLGKGNLCLNCHQPRIASPMVPNPSDAGMLEVTSSRYGPHHGAQGSMLVGAGGYEVGGNYTNSSHVDLVPNACITCHMAPVLDGRAAGGHTFRIETEDGDLNTNGCLECHTSENALMNLVENTQGGIQDLLDELAVLLRDVGILNANSDSAVPGTYTAVQVGAYYNYAFVIEDQSMGVHNANYARTLIQNSIDALQ